MPSRPPTLPQGFSAFFHDTSRRFRGYLPHLEGSNRTYFVTFRLADSLPAEVRAELRKQRPAGALTSAARPTPKQLEKALDRGSGACYLNNPETAGLVASALRHFDRQRYRLFAWCVMPNHVHVVFEPLGLHRLPQIIHTWKSFTAHRANLKLGRVGDFWQREYYDRLLEMNASSIAPSSMSR